jgi:hypothetical protein
MIVASGKVDRSEFRMSRMIFHSSRVQNDRISGTQRTEIVLRENFADSEDTDPRRSHPGVFSIDVNLIPLSIVETLSINQRLCEMI